jgi:tetratricopeptide (TPR) repeat protein
VPPLSDVLLRLLADNGKHFTRLRDDERLTVVVTFRGPRADALPLATFTSQNQPNAGNPLSVSGNTIAFGTGSGTVNVADGGTLTFNAAAPQTARDLELLGDLHQKQGQLSQAIDAFTKAVTAFRGEWTQQYVQLKDEDQRFQESLKALRRLGELQSKLAQAQIATGQLDLAARTLEALQRDKDQANQTAARKPAPAAKATGANLPARLTVSATKRQLDLVGSGKMSFEEFRKEAKVEFHPAAGADKPAAGGEKK